MNWQQDQIVRLGNLDAMLRAGRWSNVPASEEPAERDNARQCKRRLVALFCKMLGDQIPGADGVRLNSGPPLARRQRQTLELLLDGKSEKEIASGLSISKNTVHVYVKNLYKRFGVSSRAELLARWVQR